MDYHYPFEDDLESFLSGISNTQIQVIGPELIYGRLYDKIGYGGIDNEMFRHLVICRLFNPGSKLRTVEYLRQYLNKDYDVEAIYKFLDNLCFRKDKDCKKDASGKVIKPSGNDIKHDVERISYAYTKKICGGGRKVGVFFNDPPFFVAGRGRRPPPARLLWRRVGVSAFFFSFSSSRRRRSPQGTTNK